jgi:predicted PurR-regulated permease PerM
MKQRAGYYALIVLVAAAGIAVLARPQLASRGDIFLAQVGVTMGVLPNQYNTLNEELNQEAASLNAQQQSLNQEQAALASSTAVAGAFSNNSILWYLAAAVTALIVLIAINFYLDWRRARKEKALIDAAAGKTNAAPPPAP